MTSNRTLAKILLAVCLSLILATNLMWAAGADSSPLVLKIGRDLNREEQIKPPPNEILVQLKIEILHKHPKGLESLKSDKITIPSGAWATYTMPTRTLTNQPFKSLTVKLRPTLVGQGQDATSMRFDIQIFQDADLIKQQSITTGSHEAVMLELMEDAHSGSKILLKAAGSRNYITSDLKHSLKVEVKIIPLFAVDSHGKPVLDLKKKDLALIINNKKTPFQFYRFSSEEITSDSGVKTRKRNILIIIDSLFKTEHGFSLSKKIVEKLVEKGFSGDLITLLEISPMAGLRHIYGPSSNKEVLLRKIRDLKQFPDQFFKTPSGRHFPAASRTNEKPREGTRPLKENLEQEMDKKIVAATQGYSRWATIFYLKTLQKLQYILKMIKDRKLVFLVSQGTPHNIFIDRKQMDFVKDTLKSINTSETIFYTIYPKRETYEDLIEGLQTGDTLLRYLSKSAGGKYFEGSDPDVIINEVKRTTSAYYELVFSPLKKMGKTQTVLIKSKKPGVKLYYIQNTSRSLPYGEMPLLEKKIFALDAVSRGKWSRRLANVTEIPNEIQKVRGKNLQKIKIGIPEHLVNKKCDVFFLNINILTRNNGFVLEKNKFKKQHTFVLEKKDGFQRFIIIVEPKSANCIYTEIK